MGKEIKNIDFFFSTYLKLFPHTRTYTHKDKHPLQSLYYCIRLSGFLFMIIIEIMFSSLLMNVVGNKKFN